MHSPRIPRLARKEKQVAKLLCAGCSYAEIADILSIHINSVKRTIGGLYKEMGVNSATELVGILLLPLDSPLSPLRRPDAM